MASPPDHDTSSFSNALLRHLDTLYQLAQVLTQDSDAAVRLIEAMGHRHAGEEVPQDDAAARAHLTRLLLHTHAGDDGGRHSSPGAVATGALDDLHGHLAREHVRRLMPTAFAALSDDQQLVLLLSKTGEVTPEDVASILDITAESAADRCHEAYRRLRTILYERSDETGRELLRRYVPTASMPMALGALLDQEQQPVPPPLRTTVANLEHPSSETEDAVEAEEETAAWTAQARPDRLHRGLISVLLVVAAGLAGWLFSEITSRPSQEATTDLLQRSVRLSEEADVSFETSESSEAEQFVRDHLNQQVALPTLRGGVLVGVGMEHMDPGLQVPVIIYQDDETDARVTLYTYTYAHLDRYARTIRLEPEVLRQIEDEDTFGTRKIDDRSVLVWRRRDDIYVAVAPADVPDLRRRLQWSDE